MDAPAAGPPVRSPFGRRRGWACATRIELPRSLVRGALLLAGLAIFATFLPKLDPSVGWGRDNPSHAAEIAVVAQQIREARSDFWFEYNNLGYPLFAAYQPLPGLLMGAVVALVSDSPDARLPLHLSIALLWSLIPWCWYLGGRRLGLDRAAALLLGLMVPAVEDWTGFGLGVGSAVRHGLYTQTWGVALFPLAVGAAHRAVTRGGSLGRGVAWTSLCLLSHLFMGFLACLTIVSTSLAGTRHGWGLRAARLALLLSGVGLAAGFWLLPLLLHAEYQGGSPLEGELRDGLPALPALGRLVGGQALDFGRLPWISAFAVLGILALPLGRAPGVSRGVILAGLLTFALGLGPATWGAAYRRLPMHESLEVCRYLAGAQFAALFLAAVGLRFAAGCLVGLVRSATAWAGAARCRRALAVMVLAAALPAPARAASTVLGAGPAGFVTAGELRDLTRVLSAGSGRFVSAGSLGTEDPILQTLLPVLSGRPHTCSTSRGAHDSLSRQHLQDLPLTAEAFRLFHVRHAVAALAGSEPPPFLRPTWRGERLSVLEATHASGYFDGVRLPFFLRTSDFRDLREASRDLCPPLYARGILPRLARAADAGGCWVEADGPGRLSLREGSMFELRSAWPQAVAERLGVRFAGESVPRPRFEECAPGPGEYRARVDGAAAGDYALLKVSYHPRWTAEVDGVPVGIVHVAPNLMAVALPTGRSEVSFRYRIPAYEKAWAAASLTALVVGAALAVRKKFSAIRGGPVPCSPPSA